MSAREDASGYSDPAFGVLEKIVIGVCGVRCINESTMDRIIRLPLTSYTKKRRVYRIAAFVLFFGQYY